MHDNHENLARDPTDTAHDHIRRSAVHPPSMSGSAQLLAFQQTVGNRVTVSRLAKDGMITVSRLFGCGTNTPGAPSKPARETHGEEEIRERAEKFRRSNDGHLTSDQISKIAWAINAATSGAGGGELRYAFFEYYSGWSGHEIHVMEPDEAEAAKTQKQVAVTKPASDTRLRPDVLAYDDAKLGALLLHEFAHTGHQKNVMGAMDFQEGQAYGVEYFYAEKSGNTARAQEIIALMASGAVALQSMKPALQTDFKTTYAVLTGLNSVIKKTTPLAQPFDTLAPKDAEFLITEVVKSYYTPGEQLKPILDQVRGNLAAYSVPPL